jgi:hypothetical protein
LFLSVPAGNADLAGFAGDGEAPAIAPGPLLAGLTAAVAGGDGAGLAGACDDFVFAVIAAGRRMASWGTWLELSAMRELALRHPAAPDRRDKAGTGPAGTGSAGSAPAAAAPAGGGQPAADERVPVSEFAADEVAFGLRMTWTAAAGRIGYACDLAGRLPVTFAALGGGLIDPVQSLSNFLCKLGQSLSFCYVTAGSFRRPGQTGTRSGNVTANAFMAAFQPRVPVPRCPLSRTSPSPSM